MVYVWKVFTSDGGPSTLRGGLRGHRLRNLGGNREMGEGINIGLDILSFMHKRHLTHVEDFHDKCPLSGSEVVVGT